MRLRLKALLRKLVDPVGPIGEVVSPSEVYKTRLGLPVASPHSMRIRAQQAPSFAEHALAPARIESPDTLVPKDRIRIVSQFIEEHYEPIYATPQKGASIVECVRATTTRVGWRVTQHVREEACDCARARYELHDGKIMHVACGRAAPSKVGAEDYVQHVASIGRVAADDSYNVFMPTVPGPDSVQTPWGLAKGGTRITGGRGEYREKTKDFAHWDSGTMAERARAQHQKKVAMQQRVERHTEGAIKALPSKMVFSPKSVARQRAEGVRE